jgi:hypothetical protein
MNSGALAAAPRVAVRGRAPRPHASWPPQGSQAAGPAGGGAKCAPTRVKAHAINQQVGSFVATPTFIRIAPRRNQMSTAQEASNKAT